MFFCEHFHAYQSNPKVEQEELCTNLYNAFRFIASRERFWCLLFFIDADQQPNQATYEYFLNLSAQYCIKTDPQGIPYFRELVVLYD